MSEGRANEVKTYTTAVSALVTARLMAILSKPATFALHDGAPHV